MNKLAKALRELRRKSGPIAMSATVGTATSNACPDEVTVAPDTRDAEVQNCDSGIERLPAEIHRHILSTMDLHCLKAIVHTAPAFHQQYLLNRRYLLSTALQVTLGSISLDAYITQKVMTVQDSEGKHEYIAGLLDMWQEQLPDSLSFRLIGVITEAEAVDMVSFYFQTIVPIARHYMDKVLTDLAGQIGETTGTSRSASQPKPSNIEWQRCLRAIYRFQLLCCTAKPELGLGREIPKSYATRIFYTPEPWESEELVCFYQFARGVYENTFDAIAVEVHPDNPRFDDQDRPPTPVGAFEFNNSFSRRNYQEGTTLCGGLDLLRTLLISLKPDQRETLVTVMQLNIVSSYIPLDTSSGVLSDSQQEEQRQEAPSDRDKLMNERAPLPFQGDFLHGPPVAWTIIWGETYSNLIGMYLPDKMRQWGYIFWDVDRMKAGGTDVLRRQWEECWDEDPREDLY